LKIEAVSNLLDECVHHTTSTMNNAMLKLKIHDFVDTSI